MSEETDSERDPEASEDDTEDLFGLVGKTLIEKYVVESVVTRGGFGVVYRGHHVDLATPVALKVLMVPERFKDATRREFLEKFRLEARTIAALNHAAIVRVLDFGSTLPDGGDAPWMVLEWLDGRTLEAELATRKGLGMSPREALALLRPAFDALATAHEAGIAHRDIKPANMMLVKARRGEASLRMLDFGIAKIMDSDERAGSGATATRTELSAFSLLYAAPEQLSHSRTGPWTDVHALALVLTEALVGSRAYDAEDSTLLFAQIVGKDRPTPAHHNVKVGPWEAVIQKALSQRPADRHPDAGALLAELEASVSEAQARWESRVPTPKPTPTAAVAAPVPAAVPHDTLMGASASKPPPRKSSAMPVAIGVAVVALALGGFGLSRMGASPPPAAHTPAEVTPRSVAPAPTPAPPAPVAPAVPTPAIAAPSVIAPTAPVPAPSVADAGVAAPAVAAPTPAVASPLEAPAPTAVRRGADNARPAARSPRRRPVTDGRAGAAPTASEPGRIVVE